MNKNLFQVLFLPLLCLLCASESFSQNIAVNTTGAAANGSAILDVSSTTTGLLLPRMTNAQRNAIASPATGLIIYQTDGITGFYYYNGSAWVSVFSNNSGWGISGNTGTNPPTDYAGTSDATDFVIGTFGIERARITSGGFFGIGTSSPAGEVEIVSTRSVMPRGLLVTEYENSFAPSDAHIWLRRARGTQAAPAAVQAGDEIGFLKFRGYNGSAFPTSDETEIGALASENWTAAANGAYLKFMTCANGTASGLERMRIDQNGNVGIGATSPQMLLHLQGGQPRIAFYDTDNPLSATNPAWIVRGQDDGYFRVQNTPDYSTITTQMAMDANGYAAFGNGLYSVANNRVYSYLNDTKDANLYGFNTYVKNSGTMTNTSRQVTGVGVVAEYNMTENRPTAYGYGYGIDATAITSGGNNQYNWLRGGNFTAYSNSTSNTNQDAITGTLAQSFNNGTGTVTQAFGTYNQAFTNSAGNITYGYGGLNYAFTNNTGNMTYGYGAVNAAWNNSGAGTITGYAAGSYNEAFINTAQNIPTAFGSYNYVFKNGGGAASGSITNGYGVYSNIWNYHTNATGSIQNAYAFYGQIGGQPGTTAPANSYGLNLYFDPTLGGTTRYGLYLSNETQNYFSGKVGIGTTTPSAYLHLKGQNIPWRGQLSLEATDYAQISFYGGPTTTTDSKFRMWYDMAANSMNFYSDVSAPCIFYNQVGIGTTNPGISQTYVSNGGGNVGLYVGNGTPFGQSYIEQDGPAATHIWVAENGTRVFSVTAGGTGYFAGTVTASCGTLSCSDIRYKKQINPLQNTLSNVLKLQGVNYFWKTKEFPEKKFSDDKQIGLIAQDVEKIYPELVKTDADGYKSVDYSRLTPILVEAIKEQQKIIDLQKKEIENMKSEFSSFKEIVKTLQLQINSSAQK